MEDTSELLSSIKRVVKNIEMKPFYEAAGELIQNAIAMQFETEGEYFNKTPWRPLAPSTVKERMKKGFGGEHPILRRNQTLLGSITRSATSESVTIGTKQSYAEYLQKGTSKMPARPFFPEELPEDLFTELKDLYVEFIAKYFV